MDGILGIIIVLLLLLFSLYYLIHHLIASAVKKGTLEALIEYEKIKESKNQHKEFN